MDKLNEIKRKIKNCELTFGSWIQIGHPAIAEVMASQGFDWLCVDLEHGIIDIETMANLLRAIDAAGILPMARLPKNDDIWIRRCLDAGAKGLIIPMVNSEEEARFAANCSKYQPTGARGFGYARVNGYGNNFDEYIKKANEEVIIIAQIEHKDAISSLEKIIAVDGIDGLFIGPLDLSGSYGKTGDMECEEMVAAFEKYLKLCDEKSKPAGFHVVRPSRENVNWAINEGFNFIALGLDVVFLSDSCKTVVNFLK